MQSMVMEGIRANIADWIAAKLIGVPFTTDTLSVLDLSLYELMNSEIDRDPIDFTSFQLQLVRNSLDASPR